MDAKLFMAKTKCTITLEVRALCPDTDTGISHYDWMDVELILFYLARTKDDELLKRVNQGTNGFKGD